MTVTRVTALLVLAALAFALWPLPAHAQLAVFDPINWAEAILQYLQMLRAYYRQYEDLVKQVEQLDTLIQQVRRMDTNLLAIDSLTSDDVSRWLGNLRTVLARLEGIVYSADDVLTRYDELYRLDIPPDLPDAEAERRRAALDTFRTLIAGAHETANGSESAGRRLRKLVEQLDGAQGNLEALQAVGAITTEVAAESSRTAEVNAMTLNALAVQFSEELAGREQARITFNDWLRRGREGRPLPTQEFDPVPDSFRRSAP